MKKFYAAAVIGVAVLGLTACDEAKEAVESAVDTVACKALDAGIEGLSNTDDLSSEGIQKLADAAGKVSDALGALGDKVPEATKTKIEEAQQELDDAVAEAETDPEAAQQKVTDAADKLTNELEDLKGTVGC